MARKRITALDPVTTFGASDAFHLGQTAADKRITGANVQAQISTAILTTLTTTPQEFTAPFILNSEAGVETHRIEVEPVSVSGAVNWNLNIHTGETATTPITLGYYGNVGIGFESIDEDDAKLAVDGGLCVGAKTNPGNGRIRATAIPEYADNAAAISGGLSSGDFYRTGDALKIVHQIVFP